MPSIWREQQQLNAPARSDEARYHTLHNCISPGCLILSPYSPFKTPELIAKFMKIQVLETDVQADIMQGLEPSHRKQAAEVMYQAPVLLLGLSLAARRFHVYLFILFELLVDLSQGRNLLASGS